MSGHGSTDRSGRSGGDRAPGNGADPKRLREIRDELRRIFFRRVSEAMRASGLGGVPSEATLHLTLKLSPSVGTEDAEADIEHQLEQSARRAADRFAAFPAGHVYCHWCRSFTCTHSLPPEPRTVFCGYTATGQPVWREFAAVALELGDPRVDRLYDARPATFPIVQAGHELSRDQLSVYGKRSPIYRILGQVVLGYLDPPRPGRQGRDPFAITLQAVEAAAHRSPVVLNTVGRLADGTPAYQAIEEFSDPRLLDAVHTTRRRLAEISVARVPRRRRRREKERQTREALLRLAKNFDRIHRQHQRRTHHSRSRHRNRRRPTSVALRDALAASRDSIFRDVEEKTWVVLGPKNRVHVFNDQANHVTSVVYPGETVRHRTTRGKWLSPGEAEASSFREALRKRSTQE